MMMNSSNRKSTSKNSWDFLLQFLSPSVLLFSILYLYWKLPTLPEIIPVHFNGSGKPDGWGPKHTLWFLPSLLAGLHALFFWLLRNPKRFNYPVAITTSNEIYIETLTRRFMRFLLLIITIGLTGILFHLLQSIPTGNSDLPEVWLILMIGGPSISTIVYLILAGNKPKT
jgi:uncharacterized membrane protein